MARALHAVNASHEQAPVFVGTSCLRLMGIHGWAQNDHHLSPQPTVYLDIAVLSRRFNNCSRNIGTFTVPSSPPTRHRI